MPTGSEAEAKGRATAWPASVEKRVRMDSLESESIVVKLLIEGWRMNVS